MTEPLAPAPAAAQTNNKNRNKASKQNTRPPQSLAPSPATPPRTHIEAINMLHGLSLPAKEELREAYLGTDADGIHRFDESKIGPHRRLFIGRKYPQAFIEFMEPPTPAQSLATAPGTHEPEPEPEPEPDSDSAASLQVLTNFLESMIAGENPEPTAFYAEKTSTQTHPIVHRPGSRAGRFRSTSRRISKSDFLQAFRDPDGRGTGRRGSRSRWEDAYSAADRHPAGYPP